MPYKSHKCVSCKTTFEDIGLNKEVNICPRCENEVDLLDELRSATDCNCYSCMAGRAIRKAENEISL